MTLRKKTLIALVIILGCLLTALYTTSRLVVLNGFARQEEQDITQDVRRVLSALEDEVSSLNATTRDWAVWDDSYQFVQDGNEDFAKSTLADGSFLNNRLNLIHYINNEGAIVFAKGYDLKEEKEVPVPDSLLEHLAPGGPLLNHSNAESSASGLIPLSEGPMLVSSQPILTSQGSGPIQGTLIFGRYFDASEIERLARTTLYSLTAWRVGDPKMPSSFTNALRALSEGHPVLVKPINSKFISGYALLHDIYKQPVIILGAQFPRLVYQRGTATVLIFTAQVLGLVFFFALMALVFLDRVVLSRVSRLSARVAEITVKGDLGARVDESGRDELAKLGRDMNAMLVALEKSYTEQKRAHREQLEINARLQDALERLERAPQVVRQERMNALGRMASGIAHDFNNALVPISGFSELMLTRPQILEQKEKLLNYLKTINTAAKDASRIVSRLREFYRNPDLKDKLEPVDLNRVVEQAISLTEPRWKTQSLANDATIAFKTDLQDIPPIHGNESDLREVLTNLIFNSVDAMPQGGTVTISTRLQGAHIELNVGDTGTGMTEEVKGRCLEPFFTTKGDKGTGLGLPMVYGIVRKHKGMLDIQSEVGKGTIITIRLPASGAEKAGNEGEATDNNGAKARAFQRMRILLVDDEPLVRSVMAEYLKGDGHVVEAAVNGRDGLNKLEASKFDVVITDGAMPEMSGYDMALTIRKSQPDVHIIFLTGFNDLAESNDARLSVADGVLKKPVTLPELRSALAQACSKNRNKANGLQSATTPSRFSSTSTTRLALSKESPNPAGTASSG